MKDFKIFSEKKKEAEAKMRRRVARAWAKKGKTLRYQRSCANRQWPS